MDTDGDLSARAHALRREIAEHKKAIHSHRARMHVVATTLAELESEILRRRFGLTDHRGVGAIHGRQTE